MNVMPSSSPDVTGAGLLRNTVTSNVAGEPGIKLIRALSGQNSRYSGEGRGVRGMIYRVGEVGKERRHLALSPTHPSFCGRVDKERSGRTGPPFTWMIIADAALPLPPDLILCRQCVQSPLNKQQAKTGSES